LAFDKTWNSI
jgi:uncharacterized coiled-coil protein SlyX